MDHADPWPLATVSCPRLSSNAARSCVHGKFFSNYPSFCRVRGAFSESTSGVFRAVMRPARERGTSFIGSRVRCTPPSAAPFKRVQPHAGAGWIRALQGTVRLEVAVIAQAVVSQFFLEFSLPVNPVLIPAPPQPQPHFFKSYFQGIFFCPSLVELLTLVGLAAFPFTIQFFFFFLGATHKQTIVSFLAGLKFSWVFCRGSAPEQRRVVTFLSWEAKFQSHYKIFSESMCTSWFFFNLVQGFMECAVQSPGFALTVRQMSFFFFLSSTKPPWKDVTFNEAAGVTSFQWFQFSLVYIFQRFHSHFFHCGWGKHSDGRHWFKVLSAADRPVCCEDKSCIFVNISFYCQCGLFFCFTTHIYMHIFYKFPKFYVWLRLQTKKMIWCCCLTAPALFSMLCVCACGCQSVLAVHRWRAPLCLFVIDLIKENSPGLCTQRAWGLCHSCENYSCGADFCHKKALGWNLAVAACQ